tara:strand:- start:13274 stop:14293 length:1020 start_codon:yes stop_codon:yes gene_type:complete
MVQKIATVSTVFAACDRLDVANERWNRDDVRAEVGGGGFVVIDPLIKAWRALKPLREAAPTTPAELLHRVAASLEAHIAGFRGDFEARLSDSQQVFDTTVSALSERLAAMESEREEKAADLKAMAAELSSVTTQLEATRQSLSDCTSTNAQLVSENDGFRGQITRLVSEHKETLQRLQADAKDQAQENTRERKRLSDEHAIALSRQRKELTEAAEHTENRLMVLLDKERQAAKEASAQLTRQLTDTSEKAQTHREKTIELEATIRQLTAQNSTLVSELAQQTRQCADVSTALKDTEARVSSIQREFHAYREEHKISGDLGALQTAVAALQAKLELRQDV